MEFECSVQIIDKFTGEALVFIYLAAFLVLMIRYWTSHAVNIWSWRGIFGQASIIGQ